jgi:hypothetical protein
LIVKPKTGLLNLKVKVKVTNLPALTSPLASASIIAEIGEGGDMTQKALSSVMALPAAGHANDDRTRGSSIYLRGAGNQVVSISSENSNGDFYKDKAEDGEIFLRW